MANTAYPALASERAMSWVPSMTGAPPLQALRSATAPCCSRRAVEGERARLPERNSVPRTVDGIGSPGLFTVKHTSCATVVLPRTWTAATCTGSHHLRLSVRREPLRVVARPRWRHLYALAPSPPVGDTSTASRGRDGADTAAAALEAGRRASARPDLPVLDLARAPALPPAPGAGRGRRLADGDPDRDALTARARDRPGHPHQRAPLLVSRAVVDRVGGEEGARRLRSEEQHDGETGPHRARLGRRPRRAPRGERRVVHAGHGRTPTPRGHERKHLSRGGTSGGARSRWRTA